MKGVDECPNEHTINTDEQHSGLYWITCGDEQINEAKFDADRHGPSDVHRWAEATIDRHLIVWLQAENARLREQIAASDSPGSEGSS